MMKKMSIDVLTVIQIKGIINYSVGKLSTSNGNEHDKNHAEQTTHLNVLFLYVLVIINKKEGGRKWNH